jgi:hypothetical protein
MRARKEEHWSVAAGHPFACAQLSYIYVGCHNGLESQRDPRFHSSLLPLHGTEGVHLASSRVPSSCGRQQRRLQPKGNITGWNFLTLMDMHKCMKIYLDWVEKRLASREDEFLSSVVTMSRRLESEL